MKTIFLPGSTIIGFGKASPGFHFSLYILHFSFFTLHFTLIPSPIFAQDPQDYLQQLMEIITENAEEDGDFDFTELGELLDDWQRRPVDINSPEASVFVQWNIISEYAFYQLQDHIRNHGPLLSILELQSVPGFDPEIIRVMQAISHVAGRETFTQTATLKEMFLHGHNEIYLRGGRILEKSAGYDGEYSSYEGSPGKLYLRLRHRNGGVLSYGLTAEKDAGEALFKKSNKDGFDFYSAHLSLQNYKPWLQAAMIGDYSASFGQGLIMHSGFGAGKSSFVTSIKRSGLPLRPYTSVDENNILRGGAISIKPVDNITITSFVSRNRRDGNLVIDTIRQGPDIVEISTDISSLQTSNLHRTNSEIADENSVILTQAGLSVSYSHRRKHIALNGLHSSLSIPLNRNPDLYNQYYFNGDRLSNASIDYGFWTGGLHFFGETAISDNGGIATVNGLLAGIDRHLAASLLFRSYDRDYQSLTPNAFGENSGANNEKGLYAGFEITPSTQWKVQVYHDVWKHPWLKYNVDRPSNGNEYFARITYTVKRRLEIYGQFRFKKTNINFTSEGRSIPDIIPQKKSQVRLHLNNMIDKSLQLRTRLEWSFYKAGEEDQKGFLVYQDFIYKPLSSPWSVSARITLFDTDDFETRIYTYENDLIYYYAIPAFDDKGVRYYINIRYKGIRDLTAEIKYARTRWPEATSVGTGNDEIQGNQRSEVRAQVIYRFGK